MIGIFDSGSGGLTVLRAIREHLPSADILYFGDIKNAPYGEKPHRELCELTLRAIELLLARGATGIVSACNSVSAALAVSLFDALSIAPDRLIEMVGPTVSAFKDSPGKILLAATPATIGSGIYQNAFRMLGKEITTVAVPGLAAAIEFGAAEDEIERIIREAFSPVRSHDFDPIILACTHYPLALASFERALGSAPFVDPAVAVAERVRRSLGQEVGTGRTHFIISKDSEPFRARVAGLPFGQAEIEVIQ